MDKYQAFQSFWSSFGIPAYDSLTVPDEAKPPYITYSTAEDSLDASVPLTANIWYLGDSWADITAKEQQISSRIGRGGAVVKYDEGAFWIVRRTPWAQRMDDPPNDRIRRILLQFTIEYFE